MIKLTNIKVLNKIKFLSEIKRECNCTAEKSIEIFEQLKYQKFTVLLDTNSHHWRFLKQCKYITFDEFNIPDYEEIRTEIIGNMITNKLGLTEAEKWFNSLSDDHKLYVQELAILFVPIASAS